MEQLSERMRGWLSRADEPRSGFLILCGAPNTPEKVAALCLHRLAADTRVTVLSDLGGSNARVEEYTLEALAEQSTDPAGLHIVAVATPLRPREASGSEVRRRSVVAGRSSDDFHHDRMISRPELRALAVSALAPVAGDVLWDIGAGSGAVAIEWLRQGEGLRAIAIEQSSSRARIVIENAHKWGVKDRLDVCVGRAPAILADLAPASTIFIGGGARDCEVLRYAHGIVREHPHGRLVAHAVTLETESNLFAMFQALGGRLTRIACSEAEPVGTLHAMRPQMVVTQWVWKHGDRAPDRASHRAQTKFHEPLHEPATVETRSSAGSSRGVE